MAIVFIYVELVLMIQSVGCTELEEPCAETGTTKPRRKAWNSGIAAGKRKGFTPDQAEEIFNRLRDENRLRELAMFCLGVDTSLRSGNLMRLRVRDICYSNGTIKERISLIQEKLKSRSKNQVQCVVTKPTRIILSMWLNQDRKHLNNYLFEGRYKNSHLSCDQHRRYVKKWAKMIGLPEEDYSSHSLRRTKPLILYHLSGNDILVPQMILGHGSIKSTQEYLNQDSEKALELAEKTHLFGHELERITINPILFR